MQISSGFAGLLNFVYVFLCIRTCESMNWVDEIFHDWAWRFLNQNDMFFSLLQVVDTVENLYIM